MLGQGYLVLGAAAERQTSFWTKIDASSQNRRRNTVDRKMHLAIPRQMGLLHRIFTARFRYYNPPPTHTPTFFFLRQKAQVFSEPFLQFYPSDLARCCLILQYRYLAHVPNTFTRAKFGLSCLFHAVSSTFLLH